MKAQKNGFFSYSFLRLSFSLESITTKKRQKKMRYLPSNMASLPLSAAPGPVGLTGNFTVISCSPEISR